MMQKFIEARDRIKYIRLLEKFLSSIVGYLNRSENPIMEEFLSRVKNASKRLDGAKKVELYNSDLLFLQNLVDKIKGYDSSDDMEEIKSYILKESNQYHKRKNSKKYKKDKHKKIDANEW